MKNNYSDGLIANPGTRLDADGLTFDVRLPWYRSLPLSVVEFASLRIDDREVPLDGAELEVNGKRFKLAELSNLTDEWWFVLDSGYLHVPPAGLQATQRHEAALLCKLYPPYIPMLTWTTRGTASLPPQ